MKIALISRSFPPRVSGSAIVLGSLFKHFPQDSYFVFKEEEHEGSIDASSTLNCRIYSFNLNSYNIYLGRLLHSWLSYFFMPTLVLNILKITKREKADILFSVYPHPSFFIASFIAHKLGNKPFFIYMHDTWEDAMGRDTGAHRFMARIFEKRILLSASEVFVISEPLRELYLRKYGIRSSVLPHCIDLPENPPDKNYIIPEERNGTVRILFTGDVYKTNIDALKNLVDAMDLLPNNYELTLCTPADPSDLRDYGIGEQKNVNIRFVETRDELLSLQREADVLFLPLAFNSSVPRIELATIFPTKTIEYLISGTPILVHAPSDYYVVRYAIDKGWGYVVSESCPDRLREAILRLTRDAKLRQKLVRNAWRTAAIYDGVSISRKLQQYLSGHGS